MKKLQRYYNALLLGSFLALVVIYLAGIVIKERSNAREIRYLRHEAVLKDSIRDEKIEALETALTVVTLGLDSLEERYVADSTTWYQERAALTGTLQQQRRQTKKFEQAYESTKRAMQYQKVTGSGLPVSKPRVYDLSPVLGDSTKKPALPNGNR